MRRSLGQRIAAIPRFLVSIPVTVVTVALLLLAGILTGTLLSPADPTDSAITSLEFGLPAFREGRIWTLFTGAVTFTEPEFYLYVGVLLAVGLGLYERRVGSLRALAALVITHTVGIVAPALLLWPFVDSNWTWAAELGGELDAGLSAGGFGVAAAATALIGPPWRGRLRVLGSAILTVLLIKSGLLWDLEHFAAWCTGLAIGPWLGGQVRQARGHHVRTPTPARETRILTGLIGAGFAVSTVVESFYPGLGGIIGPGVGAAEVRGAWLILVELLISLLIAGALPRSHALPWWVAVAAVCAIGVNSLVNAPVLPRLGDAACAAILLGVLIWNRRAWPWRSDRTVLRPLAVLAAIMVVFFALTALAIWAAREQFEPVPGFLASCREALARFTFTNGPLRPVGPTAWTVVVATGIIWALILIGWLAWALYLSVPGRRVETGSPTGVDPVAGQPTSTQTSIDLTTERPDHD